VVLRCSLKPLQKIETVEYIQSRLEKAGMPDQQIFSPDLLSEIHLRSQGIPHVINEICGKLMLTAFALESHVCSVEMLDEVTTDMRLEWPGRRLRLRSDQSSFRSPQFSRGVKGLARNRTTE